jgi:hypothetical protein
MAYRSIRDSFARLFVVRIVSLEALSTNGDILIGATNELNLGL